MTWPSRPHFSLLPALAVSLLLHALPFLSTGAAQKTLPSRLPPLHAALRPPPPPTVAETPEWVLKTPPAQADPPPVSRPPPAASPPLPARPPALRGWQAEVQKQLRRLDERGLFYPAEAIERGIEGEVLTLVILDEAGEVTAARVEESSGQALLDAAALRAVRALRALPTDAPRETLLPVRFRLR